MIMTWWVGPYLYRRVEYNTLDITLMDATRPNARQNANTTNGKVVTRALYPLPQPL